MGRAYALIEMTRHAEPEWPCPNVGAIRNTSDNVRVEI
jgi:hypothetical protein